MTWAYEQAGQYCARILKGTSPNALPVMQPTMFNLTVNLPAARALKLVLPLDIAVRAEVIGEGQVRP